MFLYRLQKGNKEMASGKERIIGLSGALLAILLLFGLFHTPDTRVTMFQESEFSRSINWNTYRMDITHIGLAPIDSTVNGDLVPVWRTDRLNWAEYTASKSSPAVDDECLYIGLDTRALVAIDRLTGETRWSFYTRLSKNGIHGSPTIDTERNLVYIGAYDGWLYAVNRETGEQVWNSRLGDYIGSSPTLYDGVVYIGVEMRAPDGYLVGVDADNGREVFRSDKLGNHPHSTPTIDPESDCIFIGENNGYLHCYWLANQSERWSFKTGADIKSTAAILKGVVYITSWDECLYAVNISTGYSIWAHSGRGSSMSSPTLDPEKGIVYYGDHSGTLYAANTSTGRTIWRYQTDGRILSSPTLVTKTHTVLVGSWDGHVYLLDSLSGELKQKVQLFSGLTGVPVVVGDHLYVFDHLGYLYSFTENIS